MIDHRRAKLLLAAAIDNALDSGERAELEQHLHSCADCREFGEEMRRDAAELRALPLVDAPPAVREGVLWSMEDPTSGGRRSISRPMMILLAAALLVAALATGAVAGALLNNRDQSLLPDAEASPSATPALTPSASVSISASASPAPSTTPPSLPAGTWASVTTDVLNLRNAAGSDSQVLGAATHGSLVLITGEAAEAGGITWYPVSAMAGAARSGWMAAAEDGEPYLAAVAGTATQRWCGRVEEGATEFNSAYYGVRVTGQVRFAGLTMPSELFDPGMQGAMSVAWGAQTDICMELTVRDAQLVSVTVPPLAVEACGNGGFGAQNEVYLIVGEAGVSPGGAQAERSVWLHDALLGFPTATSTFGLANLAKVIGLSLHAGDACVSVAASGGLGSTVIDIHATLDTCVMLRARTSSQLLIAYYSPLYGAGNDVELQITPGSSIASDFVPGAVLGAEIRSAGGPAGPLEMSVISVPDCGTAQ